MDSINSFKGYGKVDEQEEQRAYQKKTRKRIIILAVSAVVLLAAIIAVVVGVVVHNRRNSSSSPDSAATTSELTPAASVKAVCSVTQYPGSCFSSLSAAAAANVTDPEILFKLSLRVAIDEAQKLAAYPSNLRAQLNDSRVKSALGVCESVLQDAVDRLNDSVSAIEVGKGERLLSASKIDDLKTWLTATLTDQETCLDAIRELNTTTKSFNSTLLEQMSTAMENSTEFSSNSLAIAAKILSLLTDFKIPIHRRRLLRAGGSGFPGWVGPGQRRLLQEEKPAPNVTVAKDGSGDCRTVAEAVERAPKKSPTRFVIYVKEGSYIENVVLVKSIWNVMIYGDGKDKTVLSGSKNFVDGTPTFETATFTVAGRGFIAKDLTFINTAGAAKHQAVAMRSGSDMSIFHRCRFDAFQDTLYAHSNRQFYRECDITGTIDFMFGSAAAIFQSCNIQPRKPLANQFNTITAQGKKDPNMNSGMSIQKCTLSAKDDLTGTKNYLGRPWKDFSTTVIMQSEIGSFLDPSGWIEWVRGVDPPASIFYGEYQNTGPGSDVSKRVTWAGYKPAITDDQAEKFTVGNFIQGTEWLPAASVAFDPSL